MEELLNIEPKGVFKYFREICAIPHGSGNMEKISEYCLSFAEENGLKAVCDDARNVIIYKPGTCGYENSAPVILQGHLDMVCQKTEDAEIDFEADGLDIFVDGDFLGARGTTLGADNGIAVAMIMAILSDKNLSHPPIEAVFTTDEEIGMLGASALDMSLLKGKRMINLDSEEEDIVTVSCAGGSDFTTEIPLEYEIADGKKYTLEIKNLKGGHSGVEIDKGRVNADILAGRILNFIDKSFNLYIISINGGNKCNAIPTTSKIEFVVNDVFFEDNAEKYFDIIRKEISDREEGLVIALTSDGEGEYKTFSKSCKDKLIYMLLMTPNGIIDMSINIEGLVETSLNLGILSTENDRVCFQYALRSNKKTALDFLEDRLMTFVRYNGLNGEISGRYEPWEYRECSPLRDLYAECFDEAFGYRPKIEAIHAGLECSVFASKIEGLDCIAVGPDMSGVHTVKERLSISSTNKIFKLLCNVLGKI